MTNRTRSYLHLDELLVHYNERCHHIRQRLAEFASVNPREYYWELAYCLLTPQSSAMHAAHAVKVLQMAEASGSPLNTAAVLRNRRWYIRFHNTKARRLQEARAAFPEIARRLSSGMPSPQMREWLVGHVQGLGWKEASHFLRNIGHRNLAILDRHILKNLHYHGIIRSMPPSLTPKQYLATECRFAAFAEALSIPMDELDLLFWSRQTGSILK